MSYREVLHYLYPYGRIVLISFLFLCTNKTYLINFSIFFILFSLFFFLFFLCTSCSTHLPLLLWCIPIFTQKICKKRIALFIRSFFLSMILLFHCLIFFVLVMGYEEDHPFWIWDKNYLIRFLCELIFEIIKHAVFWTCKVLIFISRHSLLVHHMSIQEILIRLLLPVQKLWKQQAFHTD